MFQVEDHHRIGVIVCKMISTDIIVIVLVLAKKMKGLQIRHLSSRGRAPAPEEAVKVKDKK